MLSDDEIWSRWKFPTDLSWKQSVINLARAIEREVRQQALEDAAHACEQQITGSDYHFLATNGRWDLMAQVAVNCADAIRAIKEETK